MHGHPGTTAAESTIPDTVSPAMASVLIISAAIGEGHDLPARWLARGLAEEDPSIAVQIEDGLATSPMAERVLLNGSAFESALGNRLFDVEHYLLTVPRPTRRLAGWLAEALGGRGLTGLIDERCPDVVVSTYPGVTEVLGRMRARGALGCPVVSAITDLASLSFWAHPGVDLHLVTHPESIAEVRAVAGAGTEVVAVRGLNDPAFLVPRDRDEARRALDLPAGAPVVVVSGGGWGVGDLTGAVDVVLAMPEAHAVVLCGRNAPLLERVSARYAAEPRVRPMGFTDELPELFAAADALVHSTAGLTVLEALARGCPVVSYGWGRGHIRANNAAFARFGLAAVAQTRDELAVELRAALASPREPDRAQAELPTAAGVLRARFGLGVAEHQVADPT
jgi:processive 1,2-diacylglycerol beta-glucosyltransferase